MRIVEESYRAFGGCMWMRTRRINDYAVLELKHTAQAARKVLLFLAGRHLAVNKLLNRIFEANECQCIREASRESNTTLKKRGVA